MLQFKDPEVEKAYESPFKGDPIVHYPGGKNKNGFKKRLSTITKEEADRLFTVKNQNLLKIKEPVTASAKQNNASATDASKAKASSEKPATTS